MIHDVLLSCLNLYSNHLPIEEFLASDAVSTYLHPCEKKILQDICDILTILRDIAKFTKFYGTNNTMCMDGFLDDSEEPLHRGQYLKSFSNGIDTVLEDYFKEIGELERMYLQNPSLSLMFVYQKLSVYEPLFFFLRKLIRGIQSQRLHGCTIMQYLYQNMLHGDERICRAMQIVQSSVNVVFLKQLTHWILYAKIIDEHSEFFIQSLEGHNRSMLESEKAISTDSGGKQRTLSSSETTSTCTDIWRYEVCYELLPLYLSSTWAEKVLFIGQTVLMFKIDANKSNKSSQLWNKSETNLNDDENSLWNEKEHFYFLKMQALQDDAYLNVSNYERIIDDIKKHVTTRLSEIAINQADLVKQLKLIKDFYMLGRGELYFEFIRQTYDVCHKDEAEKKVRVIVKAFEAAAHATGVVEELEQFTLSVTPTSSDGDEVEFGFLQHLHLQYKINWPLQLLFSPKVMERYNNLFRFLLLIKKMQYALQMLWRRLAEDAKGTDTRNIRMMNLCNQFMFVVNNLQYYIQVDVLESQFSILLNTVLNKADFEQFQRAHSVFLANVLSQCFLLADEDVNRISIIQYVTQFENPVYAIFHELFQLCQSCAQADLDHIEIINDKVQEYEKEFSCLMERLISLLITMKAAPTTTPLSQLLLRLDFNHWFTSKQKKRDY